MRKILVFIGLFAMFTISSCNTEDDLALRFELLKITGVTFPADLQALETYQVRVTYLRPTGCHYFEGFDYDHTGPQITTVSLIASVLDEKPCQELNVEAETSFEFTPESAGTYVFRFWQGKNTDGQDIYYIVDVTVE